MSNKTHAKEYLIEFSKEKPDWLKVLVKEAIATNGAISEERKNAIFDCCLKGTQIESEIVQPEYIPPKSDKLLLESLTHTSGVNALSENQTIKFSPDVTILYGLNGSGKSSYFRILNNVSVNTSKSIYPNIYATDTKPVNISVGYKLGNTSKTHDCTGSINLQSDFHGVKVFDSSYLNGLLQPKNPDETLVFPLGLHLFGYIAQIMDEYSKKITQCIEYEKSHLPIIRTESFNGSTKDKFDRHEKFTADEKKQIKANFVFTDDEKQVLIQSEKELNELRQINYEDKIKLLTKENNTLSNFITKINDITKKLNEYKDELRKAFAACTIAILLRRAVEKIIDEYVFKNQLPPRVSNKNSRINWDELKHINEKTNLIEKLRDVHNDLSEEDHVGTASIENPASIDKLRDLSKTLGNIIVEFRKTDNPDYSEVLEDILTSK